MTPVFDFTEGNSPLLISIPHAGTALPAELDGRWSDAAVSVPDTDWHVEKLYAFAADLGASIIKANYSRYVIDLNRPVDGSLLYPGQRETGLCPLTTFDDQPVYTPGREPDAAETSARVERYWRPYHNQLAQTLGKLRDRFGFAVLWDAHSIRSHVPVLFEGRLPDFNLGTGGGTSCPQAIAEALLDVSGRTPLFTAVLNGRFKGGFITRNYGRPDEKIIAVQLELAQSAYMDETQPLAWNEMRAAAAQQIIRRLLEAVVERGLQHFS